MVKLSSRGHEQRSTNVVSIETSTATGHVWRRVSTTRLVAKNAADPSSVPPKNGLLPSFLPMIAAAGSANARTSTPETTSVSGKTVTEIKMPAAYQVEEARLRASLGEASWRNSLKKRSFAFGRTSRHRSTLSSNKVTGPAISIANCRVGSTRTSVVAIIVPFRAWNAFRHGCNPDVRPTSASKSDDLISATYVIACLNYSCERYKKRRH